MAEFYLPLIPNAEFDAVTVSATNQELSVTNYCTQITGTGSAVCVADLPNGTKIGQMKKIVTRSKASATSITVTLLSHYGASSDKLTLTETGDFALCQWQKATDGDDSTEGAAWRVIETGNIDEGSDLLG
jgi:hypothetical protein